MPGSGPGYPPVTACVSARDGDHTLGDQEPRLAKTSVKRDKSQVHVQVQYFCQYPTTDGDDRCVVHVVSTTMVLWYSWYSTGSVHTA